MIALAISVSIVDSSACVGPAYKKVHIRAITLRVSRREAGLSIVRWAKHWFDFDRNPICLLIWRIILALEKHRYSMNTETTNNHSSPISNSSSKNSQWNNNNYRISSRTITRKFVANSKCWIWKSTTSPYTRSTLSTKFKIEFRRLSRIRARFVCITKVKMLRLRTLCFQ